MLVKVSFSGYVDTNRQDQILKSAIENCANGIPIHSDIRLVTSCFLARFDDRYLQVDKANPDDTNFRLTDKLNPF